MSNELPDLRVDYIELPSSDIATSKAFLQQVFGWEFTDYGPTYTAFKDGRLDGGLDGTVAPTTGGTLMVVYAKNLEASLEKVRAAGAEMTREIYSFPGGRRFQFRIPASQEIAVWSE